MLVFIFEEVKSGGSHTSTRYERPGDDYDDDNDDDDDDDDSYDRLHADDNNIDSERDREQ